MKLAKLEAVQLFLACSTAESKNRQIGQPPFLFTSNAGYRRKAG